MTSSLNLFQCFPTHLPTFITLNLFGYTVSYTSMIYEIMEGLCFYCSLSISMWAKFNRTDSTKFLLIGCRHRWRGPYWNRLLWVKFQGHSDTTSLLCACCCIYRFIISDYFFLFFLSGGEGRNGIRKFNMSPALYLLVIISTQGII